MPNTFNQIQKASGFKLPYTSHFMICRSLRAIISNSIKDQSIIEQ
jgi:hypothetical protein